MIHPRLAASKSLNTKPSTPTASSSQQSDRKAAESGHHSSGAAASESTQVQPQPAHVHMDRHHAELRPAQTISDVYMATNMDSVQAMAAGGSKQYL